jgi:hypothetical protein|tara:strand:- start:2661 stop:2888 length:228 start_codon:yes stop_codon:yes gene_type:complete
LSWVSGSIASFCINEQPAKPVDRLALGLGIATFAIINLAVLIHFTAFGPPILVKILLGLGLATGAVAWVRLNKSN